MLRRNAFRSRQLIDRIRTESRRTRRRCSKRQVWEAEVLQDRTLLSATVSLAPIAPAGSLINESNESGVVAPVGGTATFEVNLDAGQTLSAAVTPAVNVDPVAPTLQWDAAQDTDGDNLWEDTIPGNPDPAWTFFDGPQTPVAVSDSQFDQLTAAYSFGAPGGGASMPTWQNLGFAPRADVRESAFEVVFSPDGLTGSHVLLESGGNVDGLVLKLEDDQLIFRVQQFSSGSGNEAVAEISTTLTEAGRFYQAVAVVDPEADEVHLYLDGQLVASSPTHADGDPSILRDLTDWAGGSAATTSVAQSGGGIAGAGSFTTFDGDIALIRYYFSQPFGAAQVQQNYQSLSSPLQPVVTVLGPSSTVLGTASAASAGSPAALQTVAATTAGTYTIEVSGVAGSTGAFGLDVVLNAALETESSLGTGNNTVADAESIDGSFISLGAGTTRGAVVGALVPPVVQESQLQYGGIHTPNVISFDFTADPTLAGDATLTSSVIADLGSTFEYVDYFAEGNYLGQLHVVGPGGNVAGDFRLDTETLTIPESLLNLLAADGVISISAIPNSAVGDFGFQQLGVTLEYPLTQTDLSDVYAMDLQAGQAASLAVTGTSDASDLHLELLDAAGTTLALGVGATNVDEVISDFVPTADGTFYARVSGSGEYSLVVTRGSGFDTEVNDPLDSAQTLSVSGAVLGALETASSSEDFESGDLSSFAWTTFGNADWFVTTEQASSGSFSARAGDIGNGQQSFLEVTLDTEAGDIQFQRRVSSEGGYDYLRFFIDGQQVANWSGVDFGFSQESFPVTAGTHTFRWGFTKDFSVSVGADTAWIDDIVFPVSVSSEDFFTFSVNESDALTLSTSTPGDGPFEPQNGLDPIIELYDPSGVLVASDDNSAADGRNATVNHTAAASGIYTARVTSANSTAGDYVLNVLGNTGTPEGFAVAATDIPDGARYRIPPASITVDFNDSVLLSTLSPGDLLLDGVGLSSFTVVDGDSVVFDLPAGLAEGSHTLSIASGSVLDIQSTEIAAFSSTFVLDFTGPRVVATSIAPGGTAAPGDLSYQVTFDEPMLADNLSLDDFSLRGNIRSANYSPSSFEFDPTGTVLTLQYADLPDDSYTLTLLSGATGGSRFTDLVGNALDGEYAGILPSGDGVPGGDFVVDFILDLATEEFPAEFEPIAPAGSLVYEASSDHTFAFAGDQDTFTLDVDPGQTITIVVTGDSGVQPHVTLLAGASGDNLLASAVAESVGGEVVLQTVATAGPIANNGPGARTYRIVVEDVGEALGIYDVQVLLNAALEDESHGGEANDAAETAQDLESAFVQLNRSGSAATSGAQPARAAVLGTLEPSPGGFVNLYDWESFESGSLDSQWTTSSGEIPIVDQLSVVDDLISGNKPSIQVSSSIAQADLRDQFAGVGGNWGYDNPIPGTGGDDFAVVSTGTLIVHQAGTYSFALSGDDGGRLRIDGLDVIVDDALHAFSDRFGEVTLSAGLHTFEWVGFERGFGAAFELSVAVGSGVLGPVTSANGWQVVGDSTPFSEISLDGQIDVTAYYAAPEPSANGRIQVTGAYGTSRGNYALLMDRVPSGSFLLNEAVWTVDLSGRSSAILQFDYADYGDELQRMAPQFTGSTRGDGVAISDDGVRWRTVFTDLNLPRGQWETVSIDLAAEAAAAGMLLGPDFQIKFQQFDNFPLLSDGLGFDEISIGDEFVRAEDLYSLSLTAGESVTLALTGPADLELLDPAGTPVAVGAGGAEDVDSVIGNYVASATGTYLVRISSTSEQSSDYSLVVTRNADFEFEENDSPATAQPVVSTQVAGRQWMLGSIEFDAASGIVAEVEPNDSPATAQDLDGEGWNLIEDPNITDSTTIPHVSVLGTGNGTFDYYSFTVENAGDRGIFDIDFNSFDTELFLYDTSGNLIQSNDDSGFDPGGGGLASFIEHTFAAPGTYIIGVGRFDSFNSGGQIAGSTPRVGDSYTLHVSLEGQTPASGGPNSDFYEVVLGEGQPLQVETGVPAAGMGAYDNQLDPVIRIYNESGDLVAEDDNSASDGRNARLVYNVPAGGAGTYFIEITSSDLTPDATSGDYILSMKGNVAGEALYLEGAPMAAGGNANSVTDQTLQRAFQEAVQYWDAGGFETSALRSLRLQTTDLVDSMLGYAFEHGIMIDSNAAGYGWAYPAAGLSGSVDLYTTIVHEVGHALGFEHIDEFDVMHATLEIGTPGLGSAIAAPSTSVSLPMLGSAMGSSVESDADGEMTQLHEVLITPELDVSLTEAEDEDESGLGEPVDSGAQVNLLQEPLLRSIDDLFAEESDLLLADAFANQS